MPRWASVSLVVLVAGVLAGIAIRQASVEREASHRRAGFEFGSGPSGMLGQRGFWTGLAGTDSASRHLEISALRSVLDVIPDYAPAYRALSLAYALSGSSHKAIEAGRTYSDLRPEDVDGRLLLASVYSMVGASDEALAELGRVEAADSLSFWVDKMLGDVFVTKGMVDRAVGSYLRFIERAPHELLRADGWFSVGRAWASAGRSEDALAAFERAVVPGLVDVRPHWGRGMVHAAEGRLDLAREALAALEVGQGEGARLPPGLRELLVGRIRMGEGRWEEAMSVLEEASEEAYVPDRLECLVVLAESCWRAGHPGRARGTVGRCLAINPAHAPARYLMARILERQGARDEAASEYRACLEVWRNADPGFPGVEDARRRLERLR